MTSVFDDKSLKPENEPLFKALGKTAKLWKKLRNDLENELGELIEDWKYYGQKSGWTLKLLRKKRNLFFMIPQKGFFRITLIFGDKAVSEVEKSDVPEDIKEELRAARKYAEGRGIGIDVQSSEDVETINKLVNIKLNT